MKLNKMKLKYKYMFHFITEEVALKVCLNVNPELS